MINLGNKREDCWLPSTRLAFSSHQSQVLSFCTRMDHSIFLTRGSKPDMEKLTHIETRKGEKSWPHLSLALAVSHSPVLLAFVRFGHSSQPYFLQSSKSPSLTVYLKVRSRTGWFWAPRPLPRCLVVKYSISLPANAEGKRQGLIPIEDSAGCMAAYLHFAWRISCGTEEPEAIKSTTSKRSQTGLSTVRIMSFTFHSSWCKVALDELQSTQDIY